MYPEILRDEAVARLHQLGKVFFLFFISQYKYFSCCLHSERRFLVTEIYMEVPLRNIDYVYEQSLVAETSIEKD